MLKKANSESFVTFIEEQGFKTIQQIAVIFDRKATSSFRRLLSQHGLNPRKRVAGFDLYAIEDIDLVKDKIPPNRLHKKEVSAAEQDATLARLTALEARLKFVEEVLDGMTK
jgi:hypothetical protein